jgi:hypothetical protein
MTAVINKELLSSDRALTHAAIDVGDEVPVDLAVLAVMCLAT